MVSHTVPGGIREELDMHDLNTIARLNKEAIEHEALHWTQSGFFVVKEYEGLHFVNATRRDTHAEAVEYAEACPANQGTRRVVVLPILPRQTLTPARDQSEDRFPGFATAEEYLAQFKTDRTALRPVPPSLVDYVEAVTS